MNAFTRRAAVFAAILVTSLPASSVGAERKEYLGLSGKEFGKVFRELRDKDWYPTTVRGYERNGRSAYDVTWVKGGSGEFRILVGMNAERYRERRREAEREGYKATWLYRWHVHGHERFAVILRKKD